MDEIRATVKIHNNRLKSLREKLGVNQKDTAKFIGITLAEYADYEQLKQYPTDKKTGKLKTSAIKIAEFFNVDVNYLFPEILKNVKTTSVIRTFDTKEIALKMANSIPLIEAPNPDEAFEKKEMLKRLNEALMTLTPREEKILRWRFEDEKTLLQIAKEMGFAGQERVRQIEAKALRKLRHPTRAYFIKGEKDIVVF